MMGRAHGKPGILLDGLQQLYIFFIRDSFLCCAVAFVHANVVIITRIVLYSTPTPDCPTLAFSRSTPTRSAANAAALMAAAPEERLDVLNAAGQKTGVSKPRHVPVPSRTRPSRLDSFDLIV
jgi:hypothetical protein